MSLVHAADADVVILSSNGIKFHLHKRNLECTSGGFPPAETPTNGEVVRLSEPSATLELLFQYIYPRQHPTLRGIQFDQVLALAEAAEKYEVFAAMSVCHFKLRSVPFFPISESTPTTYTERFQRDFVHSHSKEVLEFACTHQIEVLVEDLAPIMIDTPLHELATILARCPRFGLAWVCTLILHSQAQEEY